jgi:hypothetical protein
MPSQNFQGFLRWVKSRGVLIAGLLSSNLVMAFPENVRYGYNNCSSCHVSPTGGGAVTAYGREASSEFLSTWGKPSEMAPFHGALKLPDAISLGGDVRVLAFYRENELLREKRAFPMQADIEASYRFPTIVTIGASMGVYDQDAQIRRAYVMANFNDYVYARVGRFFPAYGLLIPDHTALIRKSLGFNQGRESTNVELGLIGEIGEIIIDAQIRESSEEFSANDKGFSARAAAYVGGHSQLGLSALNLKGSVWKRQAIGAFATVGLSKTFYLLAEVDWESKKPVEEKDLSIPSSTRVITYSRLGWELSRGIHILGLYETSINTKGTFDPHQVNWGPGIQWFPRPHWELLGQFQSRFNDEYKNPKGYLLSLMSHYYL